MNKGKVASVYPEDDRGNPLEERQVRLDLARFRPQLDADGVLTVTVQAIPHPIFDEGYVRAICGRYGQMAEMVLDREAERLQKAQIALEFLREE